MDLPAWAKNQNPQLPKKVPSVIAGIDPGVSPALCILGEDRKIRMLCRLPEQHRGFDVVALRVALIQHGVQSVYTELVNSMPKQGVVSVARFMYASGVIAGVAQGLAIPVYEILPTIWKRALLSGYDIGDDDSDGDVKKRKHKAASIQYARDNFPDVVLKPTARCRVEDHNLADAICLASFGQSVYPPPR